MSRAKWRRFVHGHGHSGDELAYDPLRMFPTM